jgi:DNA mismatch repair ATPase MutS
VQRSTNECEGSAVARHLVDGLTEIGVTVVFVTHLHELASSA